MESETPLIWTSRGNLPRDELVFSTAWIDTPEFTKLTETYTASDGEIVREDAHIYARRSFEPIGLLQDT